MRKTKSANSLVWGVGVYSSCLIGLYCESRHMVSMLKKNLKEQILHPDVSGHFGSNVWCIWEWRNWENNGCCYENLAEKECFSFSRLFHSS